jgi:hypothetical protein
MHWKELRLSEIPTLTALMVSFALVLISDLGLIALLWVLISDHFSSSSRSHLKMGFFVAVSAFAVFILLEKFLLKVVGLGVGFFGATYALLGVSAVLIGVAGYLALTSIWRFGPALLSIWGAEQIYLWYRTVVSMR